MPPRVAIVDDNRELAALLKEVLTPLGEVCDFDRSSVTVEDLVGYEPRVIVIDPIRGQSGTRPSFDLVNAIRTDGRLLDVALLICSEPHAIALRRAQLAPFKAVHFLAKPFDLDAIEGAVAALLRGEEPRGTELPAE